MADENSFDPHSWSKPRQDLKARPEPDALPEAWKAVVDGADSLASQPPVARTRKSAIVIAAVLSIILAAGGGWYWSAHKPAVPVAAAGIVDAAPVKSEPAAPMKMASSRRLVLASPDDLLEALRAAGLASEEVAAANKAALSVLGAAKGQIQAVMDLVTEGNTVRLDRLEASLPDGSGAVVFRKGDGEWQVSRIAAELTKQIKVVRGEMDSDSFYSSAVAAGVVDTLIPEFVNAFSFDFDLQQEVAPGDRFEVAYEQTVNAEGQPLGQPQLLFASLVTAAKSRNLYRYKAVGQDVGWYDGNGGSTVRSFMRTPVDGARITSKFGMRFHPVLHYTRLHGGTDFGAPVGTPIYAAADGVITSATPSRCAGNMVTMRHDNGWETRYFHLSRYADGLTAGQRVQQGFTVGFVGNTGTCTTGPHLHYEVHIDGQKVDPLSIKTESGRKGLEGAAVAAFLMQRDRVDVARARQAE
jgi:murein DD-endopeptidase MepM/ murein hydrolase activator NlpD